MPLWRFKLCARVFAPMQDKDMSLMRPYPTHGLPFVPLTKCLASSQRQLRPHLARTKRSHNTCGRPVRKTERLTLPSQYAASSIPRRTHQRFVTRSNTSYAGRRHILKTKASSHLAPSLEVHRHGTKHSPQQHSGKEDRHPPAPPRTARPSSLWPTTPGFPKDSHAIPPLDRG